MNKRPTITDVARAAGVSLMSVSRAMNGRPGVSEDTRRRILEVAQQMDFHPSRVARGLATRQTANIGLVVPDVANPFFAHIARGAEDVAHEQGYSLFLINSAEDSQREITALNTLCQQEICGAILCSPRLPLQDLQPFVGCFPATVLVNREVGEDFTRTSTVNVDDRLGASLAVAHFVAAGRKRIGYVAGPPSSVSSQRRLEGYRSALAKAGLAFDPARVAHCPPVTEGGRLAALQLFESVPAIDAVFCFNDLSAVGVLQACQETGRNIPQDVAVIGADDIPLASLVTPRLSTLRVDAMSIGRTAMSLLLELIDSPLTPRARVVTPELILRQSA